VHDGTHAGTRHDYTWLGLPGTNGSPELQLPRPYIYIYSAKLEFRLDGPHGPSRPKLVS
jgi:hypothetical protein